VIPTNTWAHPTLFIAAITFYVLNYESQFRYIKEHNNLSRYTYFRVCVCVCIYIYIYKHTIIHVYIKSKTSPEYKFCSKHEQCYWRI